MGATAESRTGLDLGHGGCVWVVIDGTGIITKAGGGIGKNIQVVENVLILPNCLDKVCGMG